MTKTPDTNLQYRTPTVKDRHRLPMQCVVRTTSKDEWKPALLIDIFPHSSRNFAVVPSDASPADVKAGRIQIEYYKECLIRNTAPTPAESIVDPPPQETKEWRLSLSGFGTQPSIEPVLQGTSLEIPKACGELSMLIALKQKLLKEIKELSVPTPHNTIDVGSEVVYQDRIWKVTELGSNENNQEWCNLKIEYLNGNTTTIAEVPAIEVKLHNPPQENNTVVNEQGGKQSHLDARFDCIPPVVLRLLAQCLGFGARKYGKDNWKNIPQWDHLNHAVNHINEWNRGNRDEPHLVNAMARLTFALWQAVDTNQQPDTYQHPDQLK